MLWHHDSAGDPSWPAKRIPAADMPVRSHHTGDLEREGREGAAEATGCPVVAHDGQEDRRLAR